MSNKALLSFIVVVLLSLVAAVMVHRIFFKNLVTANPEDPYLPIPIVVEDKLPEFTLNDLDGNPQTSQQWQHKIIVINFWATWCPPCRKELPEFINLQREYGAKGLQFVGIAIDELEDVRRFAAITKFNFPVLIGNADALHLSERLGNRLQGLPYTVIFNRDGEVVYRSTGAIGPDVVRSAISPLL